MVCLYCSRGAHQTCDQLLPIDCVCRGFYNHRNPFGFLACVCSNGCAECFKEPEYPSSSYRDTRISDFS